MKERIVQIIPADGWHAKYKQDDGSMELSRLTCFALIEVETPRGKEQAIHGMDADSSGFMDRADGTDNFAGYVHESDPTFRRPIKIDA